MHVVGEHIEASSAIVRFQANTKHFPENCFEFKRNKIWCSFILVEMRTAFFIFIFWHPIKSTPKWEDSGIVKSATHFNITEILNFIGIIYRLQENDLKREIFPLKSRMQFRFRRKSHFQLEHFSGSFAKHWIRRWDILRC